MEASRELEVQDPAVRLILPDARADKRLSQGVDRLHVRVGAGRLVGGEAPGTRSPCRLPWSGVVVGEAVTRLVEAIELQGFQGVGGRRMESLAARRRRLSYATSWVSACLKT
jgi:hypothetical protein